MKRNSTEEPRTIWIARHGRRIDDVDPTWRSRAGRPFDPPLCDEGVAQARALGERLARGSIRSVYASPLLRTVQTAHHATAALQLPVRLEEGIFEWASPDWYDAQPDRIGDDRLAELYPSVDRSYRSLGSLPRFPESWPDLDARLSAVMPGILGARAGDMLIITHAAPAVALMKILAGVTPEVMPAPCSVARIVRDGDGWRLARFFENP